jgi:hypothetical protein
MLPNEPIPSCPAALSPQHLAVPPGIKAQVPKLAEANTAVAPARPTAGLAGVNEDMMLPVPSSPKLLLPQHRIVPSEMRAQLCNPPAAIAATVAHLPPEQNCGAAQSVLRIQPVVQPPVVHPIEHICEAGATHVPFKHVLWPVKVPAEQVGPAPQLPVEYVHAPPGAPAHIPAQVPVPQDRPPTGAPSATGMHFPRLPA